MSLKRLRLTAAGFMVPIMLTQPSVASAAEVKILCSNGLKAVVEELVPQFEQATTHKVVITYGVAAALKRQIEAGEPFDVAVLTPPLIDDLIKQRKIASDTRMVVARSAIALAIRVGAKKPDIRTTDALERTLLESQSIALRQGGRQRLVLWRTRRASGPRGRLEVQGDVDLWRAGGRCVGCSRRGAAWCVAGERNPARPWGRGARDLP